MRKKDTTDVIAATTAIILDGLVAFIALLASVWIRFDSGWVPLNWGRDESLYTKYSILAVAGSFLILLTFQYMRLFKRPQQGVFSNKIPRLIRACATALLVCLVAQSIVKNLVQPSNAVIVIAVFTLTPLILLERYILFRIELHTAKHSPSANRVLIVGTGDLAARLAKALRADPRLRARVGGFIKTDNAQPDTGVAEGKILGNLDQLKDIVGTPPDFDQVILTTSNMPHNQIVEILLFCERNLIRFNMIPDIFRIMTACMEVELIEEIPLLGVCRWPLDRFRNRLLKRTEDIASAVIGLLLAAIPVAIAAILIKRSSPGPIFFRQSRCGEQGRTFTLYKLRTMQENAEGTSGPVFTTPDDPRTTPVGAWLRAHNIDELPQLWNVLKGEMSLVGPRPERPHFVEQFRNEIDRYMWRHISKPGLTGWAQINGLRGDTSIAERIKYDLYYLEHWSFAFDFKIITKTFFANKNAY